jgi:siroheme synthase
MNRLTNGDIFILGHNQETEEVFDNNGIAIEFLTFGKNAIILMNLTKL